ncbi:MAG: hypothetical protein LBP51_03185 [Deferribacteraceae bacterium]|jgi:uncharacterized protein YfaS (alpha-2-macroglobulin family)|nr:hypothetical protein [Deferribacteraceae bacterium]
MLRKLICIAWLILALSSAGYAAEIKVVDAVSTIKDGEVIIAVIFDKPVDPKFFYDDFISISSGGKFYYKKGVVDANRHVIYYSGFPGGKKFHISVWQGFQGANAASLESDFSKQLTTPTLKAEAHFVESGLLTMRTIEEKLLVNVSNLSDFNINYYMIPFSESADYTVDNYSELLAGLTPVASKSYKANALNRQTTIPAAIPKEIFNARGLYFAAILDRDGAIASAAPLVYNELNMHARFYPSAKKNNLAVWVRSGDAPAVQAEVKLFSNSANAFARVFTDANGKVEFNIHSIDNLEGISYITADKDNLSAVLLPSETLNLADYDAGGVEQDALIYGAKDAYIKGEIVRYYLISRDNENRAAKIEGSEFTFIKPDGELIKSAGRNNLGYSEISLKLEDSFPTGDWKLIAVVNGVNIERRFSVDNPPTARLTISADKELAFEVSGEDIAGRLPAIGRVEGFYSIKPIVEISSYEGYSFGLDADSLSPNTLNALESKTLIGGVASFNLRESIGALTAPLAVTFNLQLINKDRRIARLSEQRVLFPAAGAVGVKYTPGSKESIFSLVNVDSDGKAKRARFSCTLYKQEESLSLQQGEEGGAVFVQAAYPLREQIVEFIDAPKELKFKTAPGSYRLEIKNLASSTVSAFSFSTQEVRGVDEGEIVITLDKSSYQPTQILQANVSSPFDGNALLVVEDSEKILRTQTFSIVNGKGEFSFPINARWNKHDIYISAFIYNPDKKSAPNHERIAFGIAYLPINLNAIELEIDHPAKAVGGREVEVVVRASDNYEAALAALALADTASDSFFNRKAAYLPIIFDNSLPFADTTSKSPEYKPKLREGGGITILTNPVLFNKEGEVRFKINLPYYQGRLHLTALAFGKEGFGSESSSLEVNPAAQPLSVSDSR